LPWPASRGPVAAAASAAERRASPDAEHAQVRPRRGHLHAILVTARPKQWAKNALVIAAPAAAGALGHDDFPGRVAPACLAFCLISVGIYAIHHRRDVAEDRTHSRQPFRAVAAGEAVCPATLSLALFRWVAGQKAGPPGFHLKNRLGLSRREQQLVGLIRQGLTNKEMASRLNLSEQTVKNHVHRMLRKVGAPDRLSIVEVCYNQGLNV